MYRQRRALRSFGIAMRRIDRLLKRWSMRGQGRKVRRSFSKRLPQISALQARRPLHVERKRVHRSFFCRLLRIFELQARQALLGAGRKLRGRWRWKRGRLGAVDSGAFFANDEEERDFLSCIAPTGRAPLR